MRVIVGKMGVGKTLYLRRFRASASDDESLYADKVRADDLPSTEDVIKTSQRFKVPFVTEAWQKIWRRAIVRCVISHLVANRRLRPHLGDELPEWVGTYADLLPTYDSPCGIGAEVRDIVRSYHARDLLWSYLEDRRWNDVEFNLAETLHGCPPIHLYLDGVDEQYSRAPMYWLKCQKGLFYAVMGLQRNEDLNRVHVVVCVRDVVLSSVLRGQHAGRYRDEPHIRLLEWDHEAILYFLNAKIDRLGPEHRMLPAVPGVRGWVGRDTFVNSARGAEESVEDYLLRHTRMIPRDVVTLGNALCKQVAKAKARDQESLSDADIWQVVDRVGRHFAEQQLDVCANQIGPTSSRPRQPTRATPTSTSAPASTPKVRRISSDDSSRRWGSTASTARSWTI